MAQLMTLPLTVACFSKSRLVLPFLEPVNQGSPGQRAVKQVLLFTNGVSLKSTSTSTKP